MAKSKKIDFIETKEPIREAVTKFGGQPVWIEKPEWPLSKETGKPMEFICQIKLSDNLFPDSKAQMAYLFMTNDDEYVDGTWECDGGENAIILQPGIPQVPVAELVKGPTIKKYIEAQGSDLLQPKEVEFSAQLEVKNEPDYAPQEIRRKWDSDQFQEYAQSLDGNKIAGTPIFLQGDEFPQGDTYNLLIQLDSTQVPFFVNFGDAGIGYGFINKDGTVAKFLWQCA
jgi:uncharacterized protein YwqG